MRADDAVFLLDRAPEALALEVPQARPERDVRRRRPLRLQRGQALDRGDDRKRFSLEQQLTRKRGAIELAHAEDGRIMCEARHMCMVASKPSSRKEPARGSLSVRGAKV